MTADSATFDLPPVMKLEDCQELHAFLHDKMGEPVSLNCAKVTRLGGMPAQMIQMASNTWAMNDIPFDLYAPSDGCIESLTTLGLEPLLIENRSD